MQARFGWHHAGGEAGEPTAGPRASWRAILLACGLLSPALSFATDVIAGSTRQGYNFAFQSAAVLSAPGAPTRPIVVALHLVTEVLLVGFAVGLWLSAGRRRSLRAISGLLAAAAVLQSVAVVFLPFDPDASTGSLGNTLNVSLMAPSIVAWFAAVALGAVAFRGAFRYFSIALLLGLLVEDLLTTAGASWFVAGGRPGSLVGVQERAMAYGCDLWLALLALNRLRLYWRER